MTPSSSPWTYSGSAADRLWHKSAIGRPAEGGSLLLSPAEALFVHHHRNVDFPSDDWLATALNADRLLMQQFAVLEALRVPGNKVILTANLEVVGQTAQDDSWAARRASDTHPRDSSPIAEVRWFQDSDSLNSEGLFEWAERVASNGRIAEVLVVDSELSVVTYRVSSSNPEGELIQLAFLLHSMQPLMELILEEAACIPPIHGLFNNSASQPKQGCMSMELLAKL